MKDLLNLEIPSQEEELKRLLNLIPNDFYKEEGSIFYDVLSIIANENIEKLKLIKEIFLNSFGISSSGNYLDLKALEVGIERKKGSKAQGKVKVYGKNGVLIPYNTVLLCDNLEYITKVDKTIGEDRVVEIDIEAIEIGRRYNLKSNSINKLGNTINGVEHIENDEAIIGGEDIEEDELFKKRYLEKIRENSTSGNSYDYKKWATSIDGIGLAKIFPLHNGPGTVKVIVIGSNGGIVDDIKLNKVKEFIEFKRPVGAAVTVESATPLTLDISARVEKSDIIDLDGVVKEFKNALNEYFSIVNLNSDKILYGKINSILFSIKGINNVESLRLNGSERSITLNDNQIAIIGRVDLNV